MTSDKPNRNKIVQWSITFPKSGDMTKEQFRELLPPHNYYGCCVEQHEDGTDHLHVGLVLKHGISQSNFKKWFSRKLPNDWKRIQFKPTRNFMNWRDYLKKEDANFLEIDDRKKKSEIQISPKDFFRKMEEERQEISARTIEINHCNYATNIAKRLFDAWKKKVLDGTYTQEEFDNKWESYYAMYVRGSKFSWEMFNLQYLKPDGTLSDM